MNSYKKCRFERFCQTVQDWELFGISPFNEGQAYNNKYTVRISEVFVLIFFLRGSTNFDLKPPSFHPTRQQTTPV